MDDLQMENGWHGLAYFQTHAMKEHAAERLNINTSGRSHEQQWYFIGMSTIVDTTK
jgi:hypothetical protein